MVPVLKSCSNPSPPRPWDADKRHRTSLLMEANLSKRTVLAQQLRSHLLPVRPESTGLNGSEPARTFSLPIPLRLSIAFCVHLGADISQWPQVNTNSFTKRENVNIIFWKEQVVELFHKFTPNVLPWEGWAASPKCLDSVWFNSHQNSSPA